MKRPNKAQRGTATGNQRPGVAADLGSSYERLAGLERRHLEPDHVMTCDEWLASDDPLRLLAMLQPSLGDAASDRRYRELACECCRRMWQKPRIATEHGPDYPDEAPEVIDALRVAEAFCAGQVSREQLQQAHARVASIERSAVDHCTAVNMRLGDSTSGWDYQSAFYEAYPATAVRAASADDIAAKIGECLNAAADVIAGPWESRGSAARADEYRRQAEMIRRRWPYPEAVARRGTGDST
jgi:hypothetical protein